MNKKTLSWALGISVVLFFNACEKPELSNDGPSNIAGQFSSEVPVITYEQSTPVIGQYIVVLNEEVLPYQKSELSYKEGQRLIIELASDIVRKETASDMIVLQSFAHALNGFVVNLSPEELAEIKLDKRVKYVEQDQFIALKNPGRGKPGGGGGTPPPQSTPWGITDVGGSGNGAASGKKVWIIDSGIDLEHPDLNVDVQNSRSFLGGKKGSNPGDQFGHGTHVAGTVGALDNSIGVVGVAAGVPLVSVRVLDRRGSGTVSTVLGGINYVAATAAEGDVANMSLGGGVSTTLDNAVKSAASAGVYFVLSAGNDSHHASNNSPARANGSNIYTISAMDVNHIWASFSNYGNPPVDYCAPGVSVYSTYKGGSYTTMSGTSMSAPHVAGILALGQINSNGTVIGDPDLNADAIAHR